MARQSQFKYNLSINDVVSALSAKDVAFISKIEEILTSMDEVKKLVGEVKIINPSDVGLGYVPNWPAASKKDAISGKDANSILSPKRMDDYMESNVYEPLATLFNDATLALNN